MWTQIIQDLINTGLTQQQIGEAVGIAQATVSTLYRGGITEPPDPGVVKVQALADYFKRTAPEREAA